MKTWLITGASSGLGACVAREALRRGDRVIVSARNLAAARELAELAPSRAIAVKIDVSDAQSIGDGIKAAGDWVQEIDVLVNNAGHGFHGAVEEASDAEARALFDTNVFGLLAVTREILPYMRARRTGHVINIGSVAGLAGSAGTGLYSASKFALEGISEAMRPELAPLGIAVTIVEPGPFRTDFNGRSLRLAENAIEDYRETAGARSEALRTGSGKQPGDPEKAARLICDVAGTEDPPLHLLVGGVAIERARSKLDSLNAEIERWETRSLATNFD